MFCGTYPTCDIGTACGDGGECRPIGIPGITFCVCAVPAPCDASCGGLSCPGAEVCTLSGAPSTCSCL